VSARHKNCGPWGRCLWEVEVAGEVKAWARFEENFFDAVARGLKGAGDFWIERSSLGDASNAFEKEGASVLLPFCAGGFAGDRFREISGTLGGEFGESREQPFFETLQRALFRL